MFDKWSFHRDAATSAFPVHADFNDGVFACNKYMYEACESFKRDQFEMALIKCDNRIIYSQASDTRDQLEMALIKCANRIIYC